MAQALYAPDSSASMSTDLSEKVELFITGHDLLKMDRRSESDPFAVLSLKATRNGAFSEVGRTEVVKDNANPKFERQFTIDYFFETMQELKIDLYDEDKRGSAKLSDHTPLGTCTFILGELVHAPGQQQKKKVFLKGKQVKNKKSKRWSSACLRVEKVTNGLNEELTFKFSASKLPSMDFLSKSDPYFEILRIPPGGLGTGELSLVYRSEVIKNNLNPRWKAVHMSSQKLCNGDAHRPLLIRVYDWDAKSSPDFIGEITTTLDLLRTTLNAKLMGKGKKTTKKKRGTIHIEMESVATYSFLDYMQGQLDLSLAVAIDFTGSNGHPKDSRSLHYLGNPSGSQYQQTLRTIGNIVAIYDSDQRFPVFGFGAKIGDVVSHDFALNGNESDPEVNGVHGIEAAYVNAIVNPRISLYGPTLFSEILQKAMIIAMSANEARETNQTYFTLLILCDGMINDFKETRDLIVQAANSYLPLSIIIVGIGLADFSQMVALDADNGRLTSSSGEVAKRDIVQFVALRGFSEPILNEKQQVVGFKNTRFEDLARDTLKEIPKQFMSWIHHWGLKPAPKKEMKAVNFVMTESELKSADVGAGAGADGGGSMIAQQVEAQAAYVKQMGGYPEPPLPAGWEKAFDVDGTPYWIDHNTQTTSWVHPLAPKMQPVKQSGSSEWTSF